VKTVLIHGQSSESTIAVNESLANLPEYVSSKRAVIITDQNVASFYRSRFPSGWDVIEIGCGESIKTMDTVAFIYQKLVDLEVDRSCFIVGIGGGIVCDIAGFAASTYMRGLPFGFVSTTLLSQVDASVGGKNGVNFKGYKNMIGLFNQPSFVICDIEMLKTLPRREFLCGFGEVVKHAAIGKPGYFDFLENRSKDLLDMDITAMEQVVYDSILVKSAVVEADEREKGERRKLNFGHTLAHALEKTTGIPHGEAVSIGMVFAANLSVHRNLLSRADAERIRRLLQTLELPTAVGIDKDNVIDAVRKDKKREGRGIHFVLLNGIGNAVVQDIPIKELEEVIKNDLH
jgi:3-dehydroquinate synthase